MGVLILTANRLARQEVPQEQTWDLTDLFISNQAWNEELEAIQADVTAITAYKDKLGTSADILLEALTILDTFQKRIISVATYASLKLNADGTDPINQHDATKMRSVLAQISAELSFFESELLMLSSDTIDQFLTEKKELQIYAKMLSDLMDKKPYTLAPALEEALASLSEVHGSPYMIYERSKSSDMEFDPIIDDEGNKLPMSFALYEDRYELSPDTSIRRNANKSFVKTLNNYKHTYAATYATEVSKQVTLARLRKYDSVTDMLLHPQQVTREMYNNQLDVIQKELAPHMRKYALLKKKQLGLDELYFCDLQAPLDPTYQPETTYDEATAIILDALKVMGPAYYKVMEKAINERWIDYSDNIGKSTGAFCSSPYGVHPYILMTWTDTMRGAFVLAHELGHAGHFYLAGKNQAMINTRASTYFIEAPSTINELLLADHLLKNTDDKRMKAWVIDQLLGTYYHNFVTHLLEGEFQRRVYDLAENGTPLTAHVLSEQKQEVLENFWGDTVIIDEGASLTWMRQPHYYMGLYPYTYSAGLTVSTAVAQKIKAEGKSAVEGWLNVLKAGGTMKPLELIKEVGIDMSKPDAITDAVAYVGSLIEKLDKSYN